MLPTTILIDEVPRCVVRPVDMKDLGRFLRNGRTYLLGAAPEATLTHRMANAAEAEKWHDAAALHATWGGEAESFFGVPL
jgi:hypothetical protein